MNPSDSSEEPPAQPDDNQASAPRGNDSEERRTPVESWAEKIRQSEPGRDVRRKANSWADTIDDVAEKMSARVQKWLDKLGLKH